MKFDFEVEAHSYVTDYVEIQIKNFHTTTPEVSFRSYVYDDWLREEETSEIANGANIVVGIDEVSCNFEADPEEGVEMFVKLKLTKEEKLIEIEIVQYDFIQDGDIVEIEECEPNNKSLTVLSTLLDYKVKHCSKTIPEQVYGQ